MKLIKAFAASAFSAALFAPAAFANDPTKVEIPVNHTVSYSCNITQTPTLVPPQYSNEEISASITGVGLTYENDDTTIEYSARAVSQPAGSFVMKAGGTTSAGTYSEYSGNNAADSLAYDGNPQTLWVKWTGANKAGAYSAIVVATCVETPSNNGGGNGGGNGNN